MPKAVKVARVLRGSAKRAAFDVVHTQPVEHLHDEQFVVEREIDARRLLAIAQGRVEEIEPFAGHHSSPLYLRAT
jgi:hypothetical protein